MRHGLFSYEKTERSVLRFLSLLVFVFLNCISLLRQTTLPKEETLRKPINDELICLVLNIRWNWFCLFFVVVGLVVLLFPIHRCTCWAVVNNQCWMNSHSVHPLRLCLSFFFFSSCAWASVLFICNGSILHHFLCEKLQLWYHKLYWNSLTRN